MRRLVSYRAASGVAAAPGFPQLICFSPSFSCPQQRRCLSLKQLAEAFGEMGTTGGTGSSSSSPSHSQQYHHPNHHHPNHHYPNHRHRHHHRSPPTEPRFDSQHQHQTQTHRTASAGGISKYASASSPTPASATPTSGSVSKRHPTTTTTTASFSSKSSHNHSSLLTLSVGHARYLSQLREPQLLEELENSYRRVHYGFMVQGLMELSRRLSALTALDEHIHNNSSKKKKNSFDDCGDVINDPRAAAAAARSFLGLGHGGHITVEEAAAVSSFSSSSSQVTGQSSSSTSPSSLSMFSTSSGRNQSQQNQHQLGLLHCRSDRILEAALRCLTKMNLVQLEPDIKAAVRVVVESGNSNSNRSKSVSGGGGGVDAASPNHALAYAYELNGGSSNNSGSGGTSGRPIDVSGVITAQLLSWLGARVGALRPRESVTFLHLLVQQRLLFSDDVLVTLVDTIVTSNNKSNGASDEPLSLRELAIFFDAMARCESSVHFAGARWGAAVKARRRQQLRVEQQWRWPSRQYNNRDRAEREGVRSGGAATDKTTSTTPLPLSMLLPPMHLLLLLLSPTSVPASMVGSASSQQQQQSLPSPNHHHHHPLLNADVYRAMTARLISKVTLRRQALVSAAAAVAVVPRYQDDLFPRDLRPTEENEKEEEEKEWNSKHMNSDAAATTAAAVAARRLLSTGGVWAEVDSVSFFFLTRAIGRLGLFHTCVVSALLPGMAEYLERHPEQYLGVVMLVGRRDNESAADPKLTRTLVATLTERLAKRRTGQRGGGGGGGGSSSPSSSSSSSSSLLTSSSSSAAAIDHNGGLDSFGLFSGPHISNNDNGSGDVADGYDQGDMLSLLSDSGGGGSKTSQHQTSATTPPSTATVSKQPPAHSFAVSLIDMATYHSFLESLCYQYSLTLQVMSRSTSATASAELTIDSNNNGAINVSSSSTSEDTFTSAQLRADMLALHRLLLDDMHGGLASVPSLFRLSPAALERTLAQLLAANQLLLTNTEMTNIINSRSDGVCGGHQKEREEAVRLGIEQHPFIVELAYAWTRLVSQSKLAVLTERDNNNSGGDDDDRRAAREKIISRLVVSGVLERVVVVQRRQRRGNNGQEEDAEGAQEREDQRQRGHNSSSSNQGSSRRYDSQPSKRSSSFSSSSPSSSWSNAETFRTPFYVIPLPLLRQRAPRALTAINDAIAQRDQWQQAKPSERNKQQQQQRGSDGSRHQQHASHSSSSPSSSISLSLSPPSDHRVAKKQAVKLAMHFSRFSTAAGIQS